MRHRKKGKKFHRTTGRRRSFLRNLVNNLIRDERLETTETRAKAIKPLIERSIAIAKKENLAVRRLLWQRLHNKKAVVKLFEDLAPRYKERSGGYVRIMKSVKTRKRDGAKTAVIEFV